MFKLSSAIFLIFSGMVAATLLLSNQPSTKYNTPTSGIKTLAPGYGALEYTPPAPGSYQLPSLGAAANGQVLSTEGIELSLYELYEGKTILLSFIYSTCNDVNGCPLATAVFHKIKRHMEPEAELRKHIRLITLSFDPQHDRPDVMRNYGRGFQEGGLDWRFLTTRSGTELHPILKAYDQTVQKNFDAKGEFVGTFSHVLRVFLIDRHKQIRNIYSVSFLHADTLLNDIKNLLLDEPEFAERLAQKLPVENTKAPLEPEKLFRRAGDYKIGYLQSDYETHSLALKERKGQSANLIYLIKNPPLGLPTLPTPSENPASAEKISLGRKLFYDRRLSLNKTFSCAMCHIPEQGFTSNELTAAVGIEGRTVRRNSPTLYNVGYATRLFHDGREFTLEQQVWGPLLAKNEMGNPSVGFVVKKIKRIKDYDDLFQQAFQRGPSMETIGMAIANYERSLNSANSAFDQWKYGNQPDALGQNAQRGFWLFTGKARCINCHRVDEKSALFTDNLLHNTGLGFRASMTKDTPTQTLQVAPGVLVDINEETLNSVSEKTSNDLGLYEITQDPEDRWKYKTPSLRNVALTSPYMHNGALGTLTEVVAFYNSGGVANENLDPLIQPLNLKPDEIADLVTFLESLTGDNVDELVADAFSAPIGDPD